VTAVAFTFLHGIAIHFCFGLLQSMHACCQHCDATGGFRGMNTARRSSACVDVTEMHGLLVILGILLWGSPEVLLALSVRVTSSSLSDPRFSRLVMMFNGGYSFLVSDDGFRHL